MSNVNIYENQAKELVDAVISNALQRLLTIASDREGTHDSLTSETIYTRDSSVFREENFDIKNIRWLSIEEFCIEAAQNKIDEFIETWDYGDCWLYCIDFIGETDHEFDKRFRFRVRWSIPTRRKPIPRATASIYFTFSISKIKPRNYPVEVYYVFETNKLVHRPGFSRFREKWLKDIIESKVLMMSAVTF